MLQLLALTPWLRAAIRKVFMFKRQQVLMLVALAAWLLPCHSHAGQGFSVATYNLQNYFLQPTDRRPAKSPEARARIRESLRAIRADVIALQEVGGPEARTELQHSLKAEGLDYPYWDAVSGADTNTQQVILSKFPILARRRHSDETFVLFGRRFSVHRGFAEVDIQVNTNYVFTLIAAHLKSRLPTPEADEADLREQEALLLRNIISERLKANPDANLLVLGDLNDHRSSTTLRTLMERGPARLIDTEPGESGAQRDPRPIEGLLDLFLPAHRNL